MKRIAQVLLDNRGVYLSARDVMNMAKTNTIAPSKHTVAKHLKLMCHLWIIIKKGEKRIKYLLPPLIMKNLIKNNIAPSVPQ